MSITDYTKDFSMDPAQTWLNVASEGPIPNLSHQALQEAIQWKLSPHRLTIQKFQQVPLELKQSIGRLLHTEAHDVILGNSATYGIHLLAHGLEFKSGDEIILLQNDFPTDILPWLSLEPKSVIVHQLKAKHHVLTPEELKKAFNKNTKLVCLPWVHSFSGYSHDIEAIGKLCRSHGILCIVNLSQAAGAFEIDLSQCQIDAVVCAGYKWLLGPYGTGFCWMHQNLREKLQYAQNYWISLMNETSLLSEGPISLKDDRSSKRYDMFGTANFFNYVPWKSSIDYLLSIGMENVSMHNRILIDQFIDGLNSKKYDLVSPGPAPERTNIIVFSHKDTSLNQPVLEYLKTKGFHLALWKNKLRLSPHIYNTPQQIRNLLETLDKYA